MNVAVLTLTRDRLLYTTHCFAKLEQLGGCAYEHFVLDQASDDGTGDWLTEWADGRPDRHVVLGDTNVGISAGMNLLLDAAGDRFDVVVKFDNDCEIETPDTLKDIAALSMQHGLLLSPRINGLQHPPATISEIDLGDAAVDEKAQIGGIFLAAPAAVYAEHDFRYDTRGPIWGWDDVGICAWWRANGGRCGYVRGYEAWHHETTLGQHTRFPAYFERTLAEGKPAL